MPLFSDVILLPNPLQQPNIRPPNCMHLGLPNRVIITRCRLSAHAAGSEHRTNSSRVLAGGYSFPGNSTVHRWRILESGSLRAT